jgi:hypothetical protein
MSRKATILYLFVIVNSSELTIHNTVGSIIFGLGYTLPLNGTKGKKKYK